METEEDKKKKMNDDVVVFMSKRSETEAPRYTARLKTYVDFQQKRRRAAAARWNSEHAREKKGSINRKNDGEKQKETGEAIDYHGDEDRMSRKKGGNDQKCSHRSVSFSRSGSRAPSEGCCPPRRRRRKPCCPRRRRRRSCRRRRRRRSCSRRRRRRSRRRRRRSCSRRRRRRSCRRRRKTCKRRRRRRC